MCRRSVLALPSSEKAKRGRFAYTALPAAHFDRNERYAYFGDRTLTEVARNDEDGLDGAWREQTPFGINCLWNYGRNFFNHQCDDRNFCASELD